MKRASIERSLGNLGPWIQVAVLSSNLNSYVDGSVDAGTNYAYRLRSWNSAGPSAYSNVRSVTVPPRPALAAALAPDGVVLTWPGWASNFNLYATPDLSTPVTWTVVTNPLTISTDTRTVTVPADIGNRFFELRSP